MNDSVAQFSCKPTIVKTMRDAKGNGTKGKSKESRYINSALNNIKVRIIKHYQRISNKEAFVPAEMVRYVYQDIGREYEIYLSTDMCKCLKWFKSVWVTLQPKIFYTFIISLSIRD